MSWWTSFRGNEFGSNSSQKPGSRNPIPRLEILEDRLLLAAGLDSNYAYIQGLYQSYLGRSGSMTELDSWQSTLVNQGTSAVVSGFSHSEEAHRHTVLGFYRQFLGRDPQNGEDKDLLKAMREGVHPDVLASAFLGSAEFYQRAPQIAGSPNAAATDTMLVRAMFRVLLHRDASQGELNNFLQNILPRNSRPATALFILTSPEYRSLSIQTYYGTDPTKGILDRTASPTSTEVQGWVQSSFRLDDIQDLFHSSVEAFHLTRVDQDVNQQYVGGLYQDVLGRTASADERMYWEDQLIQTGMRSVATAIATSHEAQTILVKSWYVSYLGREAAGGEEQTFVGQLERGTPPEAVIAVILGTSEYFAHAPQALQESTQATVETFVRALYHDLQGRTPSAAEVQDLKNQIPGRGRQGVALLAVNSPEFRTDAVRNFYAELLHRDGAVTDAEVQSWVNSRKNLGQIRKEFLTSAERFSQVVHQSQTSTVDASGSGS